MLTMATRRRRRRLVVLVALMLVVVVAIVVKLVVLNDDVHRVTPEEALERYRDGTSTTATATGDTEPTTTDTAATVQQTLPAPGVYVYATRGKESIDAVGGSLHEYPAETTITVTANGCGVSLQWDALKERRERWQLCLGEEGITLTAEGGQSFHEFFGQTRAEDITCDRDVVVVPVGGEPREPVALSCMLGELSWQPVWEVLESDTRLVDEVFVDVVHVRMTISDNDTYYEHIQFDWYLDDHGLPVSTTLLKESLSDTAFGDVRYLEEYTLDVTSLTPLR
ncbi:MAG: hypothetical protein Q7V57_15110 [Actinomycetota bacterium]|nr:hypothetical protein [Actinomycetota bacterium]